MNFLSVCSGIEAVSVAWEPLGFQAVGFSEIEPFPSAVLAHRFPHVKNYGDMTQYESWNIEPGSVDILVGGTPCQAFSVAGLRKGLADPRGNLALVFLGIADRFKPKYILWENVPGVLSSNGGRDFGSFLGALEKLGYGFAYRVLDAQFFGVPQRRRRVFVVGCLGDWDSPRRILFEPESLRGDIAPSRKKGEVVAALTANGVGTCGADDNQAQAGHLIEYYENHGQDSRVTGPHDVGNTVSAKYGTGGGNTPLVVSIQGNMIGRSENAGPQGCGYDDTGVCFTLTKTDVHAVAIRTANTSANGHGIADEVAHTLDRANGQCVFTQYGDIAGSLTARRDSSPRADRGQNIVVMAHGQANAEVRDDGQATTLTCNHESPILAFPGRTAAAYGSTVRRLTPMECERLQGFPDNWTRIPWRGKPAENCPDAPRYKACGNSMAVPVMRWIGTRIKEVK